MIRKVNLKTENRVPSTYVCTRGYILPTLRDAVKRKTTPKIILLRSILFIRARVITPVRDSTSQLRLMSLDYRLIHAATIVSIGALLLTGSRERGLSLLQFHIDFGLLSVAVLGVYSLIMLLKHRVWLFDALREPVSSQIREGLAIARKYSLGTPYPPEVQSRMGRHNILATYASLVLVLSFIPLMGGGIAMVFLQRGTTVFELARFLHLMGVGLIGLFFLVHVLAVFHPENWPLLKAMFSSGRVPIEWAREHLAGWHLMDEGRESGGKKEEI